MAKKIKLKNTELTINYGGQVIGQHNLTEELYNSMIQASPTMEALFIVEDEVVVQTAAQKTKTAAQQ